VGVRQNITGTKALHIPPLPSATHYIVYTFYIVSRDNPMIGYRLHCVFCPSMTLSRCVLRLNDTSYTPTAKGTEQMNGHIFSPFVDQSSPN